jgi:hypothetical protein
MPLDSDLIDHILIGVNFASGAERNLIRHRIGTAKQNCCQILRVEPTMQKIVLLSLLFLFTLPANAIWYEAEGSAIIYSGDIASARERATQQALKNALIIAGGTVTSLQEIAAGKVVNDQFEIRSSGTVRDVRLISERRSGDTLFVSVHADLFPEKLQCSDAGVRKSLLLTRFRLSDEVNARIGAINEIGYHSSQWLFDNLRAKSQYSYPKRWLDQFSEFSPGVLRGSSLVTPLLAQTMTEHSNTQFVLFANIRDLSLNGELPVRKWQQWLYSPPERNFELMVYLIDGISGERKLERSYQVSAPWEFPAEQTVALSSQSFWNSAYGGAVSDLLSQLLSDIDSALSCTPGRGRITHVKDNQVEIDLGISNGIRVGDKLTLMHRTAFDGQDGKQHVRLLSTSVEMRVTESYENRVIARVADPQLLSGVQVNDLVQFSSTL